MSHEYRILERLLVEGKISRQEFKERIDAIQHDTYEDLATMLFKREINEMEFVERYNRLVERDAEKYWEPIRPHEHI